MYNIVTSLACLYWAVCVSPLLSTSHVLGSLNPPISPMRFYFYPQFAGEETNTSKSYNQRVLAEGLEPRRLAALHSLLATNKNSEHQTWHPEASAPGSARPAAALGCLLLTTVCGLKSFLWNLPWPAVCTYFHFQHAISTFSLQSPHPLLCQDLMTAPRRSALSFKRSPLFLASGQGVHIPLPTGVLSLPISGSVLLLKPTEWKCFKTTAMTLLAFTSTSTRHTFPTLFGVVGPLEPSSLLWKWTSAFICSIYLDFTWSFIWKRVLFLKTFENHGRVRTYLELPKRYWAISLFPPDPNLCKASRTQAGHRSDGEGRFHLNHPVSPLSFQLTFHHHKEHFYPKDRLTPWSDLDSS